MLKSLSDKFADFAREFYNWGAGFTGKFSSFFRLARLSSWSKRRLSKPAGLVGIESFVALSLVVYFFFLTLPQAEAPRSYDRNEMNIYLFTYQSDHPYTQRDLIANFDNWRARLAGPMISGWMYDLSYKAFLKMYELHLVETDKFVFGGYFARVPVIVFGFYHALWLLLLFVILILHRRDAILIMLGVFGGLIYNFTMPDGQWFYPWDMPALFFFTWACLLCDERRLFPLMAVVWLGSLFKETILCCTLLLLLSGHWPLKKKNRRLRRHGGSLSPCQKNADGWLWRQNHVFCLEQLRQYSGADPQNLVSARRQHSPVVQPDPEPGVVHQRRHPFYHDVDPLAEPAGRGV